VLDSPNTSAKLKSIVPPQNHAKTQRPLERREDHTLNPETRKQPYLFAGIEHLIMPITRAIFQARNIL
jgi:hypothetical protein